MRGTFIHQGKGLNKCPTSCPKGPSTNIMSTLGFCTGKYDGLGEVLVLRGLEPAGLLEVS